MASGSGCAAQVGEENIVACINKLVDQQGGVNIAAVKPLVSCLAFVVNQKEGTFGGKCESWIKDVDHVQLIAISGLNGQDVPGIVATIDHLGGKVGSYDLTGGRGVVGAGHCFTQGFTRGKCHLTLVYRFYLY